MTRIRSPGYPNISLKEAIDLVDKIFEMSRQNIIDREAAAKDIGYAGLTGQSTKMLSNLAHFRLIEKAGKGGMRVSDTAVKILHPKSQLERMESLREAAYNPELFSEIHQQWPDGFVSENALRGYLMRSGFSSAAVQPATRSYMETYAFLQQERATESYSKTTEDGPESTPIRTREEPLQMIAPATQPLAGGAAYASLATPESAPICLNLNEPNLDIRGGTVRIEALLDYDGLALLEEQLMALKMLMKPKKASQIAPTPTKAQTTDDDDDI